MEPVVPNQGIQHITVTDVPNHEIQLLAIPDVPTNPIQQVPIRDIPKEEILEVSKQAIPEEGILDVTKQEIVDEETLKKTRKNRKALSICYRCEKCKNRFERPEILAIHSHVHYDKGAYPATCPVCCIEFVPGEYLPEEQEKLFKQHIRQHTKMCIEQYKKMYTCKLCGKVSKNPKHHRIHKNGHEKNLPADPTTDKHIQVILERVIKNEEENEDIEDVKDPSLLKLHQCPTCQRRFETSDILEIHSHEHYKKNEFPTTCPFCDFCFTLKPSLSNRLEQDFIAHIKLHTKTRRTEFRRFLNSCTICGKVNSSPRALSMHMKKHNVDPRKCTRCDSAFKNKLDLLRHTRTVHTLYRCKICNSATYRLKSYARQHIIKCNNLPTIKCKLCEMTFSSKNALVKHVEEHLPKASQLVAKPADNDHKYRCQLCAEDFFYQSDREDHLNNHLRYNNAELEEAKKTKVFPCKNCQKTFKGKMSLIFHVATHMERNQLCNCCHKRFTYLGLQRHQKAKVRLDFLGSEKGNQKSLEETEQKFKPTHEETSTLPSTSEIHEITIKSEPVDLEFEHVQVKEEPMELLAVNIKQEMMDY